MNGEQLHDSRVKQLLLSPFIDDVVLSGCGRLVDEGVLVAEPDGFFLDKSGQLHIFEYKCSSKHHSRGVGQLVRAARVFEKYFGCSSRLYFVKGKKLLWEEVYY